MSYKALYRVFRPKTFGDVVGQGHIVSVLKSQVIHDQVSHAYLFTGSRGTGKTSMAKIFARAISCKNSKDGEACMECSLCLDTISDSSMDIVEIDAASNNGVDEIRELRENVKYAPVTGKYKVYIIDEVHMLSGGAFNALLKTLEEPPGHAVFILATTEPQKLPETIISRCQRFDFEKIDKEDIISRLEYICKEVNAKCETDALEIISDYARGGLRDAISLLDQCIVFGDGEVTKEGVLELLGKSGEDTLFEIGKLIINRDTSALIEKIDLLIKSGKMPTVLAGDIVEHLHRLLVFKTAKNPGRIVETTKGDSYSEQSDMAGVNTLLRAIKILSAAISDMRYAFSPMIVLEVALMEACTPEAGEDTLGILARLEAVEKAVKEGTIALKAESSEPRLKSSDIPDFAPPEDDMGGAFIMDEPRAVGAQRPLEKEKPKKESVPKKDTASKGAPDVQDDEVITVRAVGDFGDKEYDEFLKRMNKTHKGIYISMKSSFFGGIDGDTFTIGYPSDDCNVFARAVEAKKTEIEKVLSDMGFKDLRVCAKIMKQDKTKDLKEIFGDDIKFID